MQDVPKQVTELLDSLTAELPQVLGSELTGIYLYGSLTQNAFNPKRSDIDCVIVTRGELTDKQFADLESWFAEMAKVDPWTERLQATILIRDEVLKMDSPGCLYQFGKLTRSGSDGNPIIWLNILDCGVTLYGEPPQYFVPEITPAILSEALRREVNYIREEIENQESEWRDRPKYRAYAVLTLCRILYTHAKGKVVSKPRAAIWAIRKLELSSPPARGGVDAVSRTRWWEAAIRQALTAETDDDIGDIPLETIRAMLDHTDAVLK